MKKGLKYEILEDTMWQTPYGLAAVRLRRVRFTKQRPDGSRIAHEARVITYPDAKKRKLVSPLANDMETDPREIIAICRQRWETEPLFKQTKQNSPLRYFYGESTDAIMIQIWGDAHRQPPADGHA